MRRTQRHRSYRDAELNGLQVSVDNLQVTREDFGQALSEVRPSFGASLDDLDRPDTPETRARCGRDAAEMRPNGAHGMSAMCPRRCARGGVLAYGGALPQLQASYCTPVEPLSMRRFPMADGSRVAA